MNDYSGKGELNFIKVIFNNRVCSLILFLAVFVFSSSQMVFSKDLEWTYVDEKEGIKLYKCKEKIDGLIPFKVKTVLNFPHEKVVKVLIDAEKKSLWAPKLKKTKIHKTLAYNKFVYSEYYTVPFPFYDREFFLQGTIKTERDSIIFSAENPEIVHEPAEDHVVVNIKKLEFKITPLGNDRTHIDFTFIGDMGGMVPKFVVNIIQSKWPIKFIMALSEYMQKNDDVECERYNTFIKGYPDKKSPG